MTEPVISVFMPVYNHAPFIEQAIESVMSQKTEYPVELVVCDDFSTDGSRDVIDRLAEKHPNIVKSYQPHNTKGVRNMMQGLSLLRGRYVAMCEGDDYMRMLLDHFLLLMHAADGKIKYFDEPMSAWRRHANSYSYAHLHDKGLFFQKEGEDWPLVSADCIAKSIADSLVLIPCGHHLGKLQLDYIIDVIGNVLENRHNALNISQRSAQ